MSTHITKLLRAIAGGSDARASRHDIIFNAAADEIERLTAIEVAAGKAIQSLRDDGWNEEYDNQALKEEWLDLMRLMPAAAPT
jgi:hypothetical protein